MLTIKISNEKEQKIGIKNDAPTLPVKLQEKTFTENGAYTADSGYAGFNKVNVDVNTQLHYENGYRDGVESVQSILNEYESEISLQNELLETAITELNGKVDPELYNAGVEDGKAAEWSFFWDAFQQNGARTNYSYAFYMWGNAFFNPKHDMKPTNMQNMFQNSGDIKFLTLKEKGWKLDTSATTNIGGCFQGSGVTEVPELDLRNATTVTHIFTNALRLKRIEKIIVGEKTHNTLGGFFTTTKELEHLILDGILVFNFSLSNCPSLDKESIVSVINAASTDESVSGKTITFSKTAVDREFKTGDNVIGSETDEWKALVVTKPNWTITLA